jgi:polysaccharide export outer membrane protein
LALLFALALLAGCSSSSNQTTTAGTAASAEEISASASALSAAAAAASDTTGDYKLGPLDTIAIEVFQVPELNKTVDISATGQINLPLLGQITAAGKTAVQLQDDLAARLKAKYLQNPQVTVTVTTARSQRITIDGAVSRPGVFPLTGSLTLLQAVAMAGGVNDIGDPSGILIIRTVNGKRQAAVFDLRRIRDGTLADPPIRAGDLIEVDESGMKSAIKNLKSVMPVMGLFGPLL